MLIMDKGQRWLIIGHLPIHQPNLTTATVALTTLVLYGNMLTLQSLQQGLLSARLKTVTILNFDNIGLRVRRPEQI